MNSGGFSNIVTSSVLARFMAIIVLFLTVICSILIATVDYLRGSDVPVVIQNILFTAIGLSGGIIGINIGIPLQTMKNTQPPTVTTTTQQVTTQP